MPSKSAQHRKFDQGFNRDVGSFLLDEGYVYTAKNMLFDKVGIARKRGGITGVGSDAASGATYQADNLTYLNNGDASAIYASHAGNSPQFMYCNTATGVVTDLFGGAGAGTSANVGPGFTHAGFAVMPVLGPASGTPQQITPYFAGGATDLRVAYQFTNLAAVSMTAGDKRVIQNAADKVTTNGMVGSIFIARNANSVYMGRVTPINFAATTNFEVWPTPTISMAAASVLDADYFPGIAGSFGLGGGGAFNPYIGGLYGMSFQGRCVLAYISRQDSAGANRTEIFPRRVQFSSLLSEGDTSGRAAPQVIQGATFMHPNGWPDLNWFDIPGSDPITAISPTGFGDAVVFTRNRIFRVTGNLSTQYGTSSSVTWNVREVPNSVGCTYANSLQRTTRGVIFANYQGVFITDGASIRPLMSGRIANYWRSLQEGAIGFSTFGSALIKNNHYYVNISVTGGSNAGAYAFMVNLDTLAWSTITGGNPFGGVGGGNTASWFINSSCVTENSTWGAKWYAVGLPFTAGVTMKNGQLVQLDTMFTPTTATKADNDGNTVNFEVVTKAYTEDSPVSQKVWEKATIEYANNGGSDVCVTPAAVLDSAEIPAGGSNFYLPRQDIYTVTAATNASPIVITCGSHNIKVDTWVHVQGVGGNTNANGPWRVQAVGATTVTLMGSVPNGAYTSGGTIQQIDTRDIPLDGISQGSDVNNAAMVYRINDTDAGGTPGADSFELRGILHSWSDRDAHVE